MPRTREDQSSVHSTGKGWAKGRRAGPGVDVVCCCLMEGLRICSSGLDRGTRGRQLCVYEREKGYLD